MNKSKITLIVLSIFVFVIASSIMANNVYALNQTVCCEKTNSGLYCQNVPKSECAPGANNVPTACESTSFCKPGVCYNSVQGTCLDNTPQIVCNANKGVWSAQNPPQCSLGCCILGDQAAFVTLTRCKYLSNSLGLQTNYNTGIKNEAQCVLQVQNQDKGACVYDFEFQRTCKFTTRAECGAGLNGSSTKGQFFKDKLCSAPELGTNCGPSKKTICGPGKDEVYFVDTCGNLANIFDSSKLNDQEYWTNVKTKAESCSATGANANSKSCGNCNYLLGSYCRNSEDVGKNADYGDFICADLNCAKTSVGPKKHGESWCVFDDEGTTGKSNNAVGSRFYKHICVNGEEVVEQCADYRQEECIQDKISIAGNDFTQAACRVNRWQDCLTQTDKLDCENTDKRDCTWNADIKIGNATDKGTCVPKNSPGLKFWDGTDAKNICAQGNYQCIVTFEKGLLGGEKCVGNCDCLTDNWKQQRIGLCQSLGDCGLKINWIGDSGYKQGYNLTIKKA